MLLITDGESWDDRGVVSAARRSRHRVFAIGVGSAAAAHLLHRLADETGGACEIVTPREGMAERIVRQIARMDARRLTGRVEWPAGATAVWPRSLGAVFAGDTIHAAAWFASPPSGSAALVTADGPRAVDRQSVDLGVTASPGTERILAQVAAAGRIAEMEDEEAAAALAVRYGLLTTHTHLVMIAERAEKLDGLPVLRRASGMVAAGWMGHGTVECRRLGVMNAASFPLMASCSFDDDFVDTGSPDKAPLASPRPARVLGKLSRRGAASGDGAPAGVIASLRRALDGADLDRIDLAWLARAGAPLHLCDSLKMLLSPEIDERALALALLYALVSEAADGRLPKTATRRIRRAWTDFGGLSPEKRSDLLEAVRAIAMIDDWCLAGLS